MSDTPTHLDLDAIRDDLDASDRDLKKWVRLPVKYVRAALAEIERLRAEVARPAPAWDEEATRVALVDAQLASVQQVMEDGYPSIFVRSNEDAADVALAVVRDRLPVKPSREAMGAAIRDALKARTGEHFGLSEYDLADVALDLLPGRSEAEVKAEAWDEGVAVALNHAIRNPDGVTLRLEHLDGQPWHNPYRIEGGAGRG